MSSSTKFDYVIYHSNCSDGISSAWVTSLVNKHAIRIGCVAGKSPNIPIEDLREKKVLFCDISPTPEFLESIKSVCAKIIVIDHHIDAIHKIKQFECDNVVIYTSTDHEKSGCILTWEYFFPEINIPWFLKYISDRDTWSWKLPYSKEINIALFEDGHISMQGLDYLYMSAGISFTEKKHDNKTEYYWSPNLDNIIYRGISMLDNRNKMIEKYIRSAIPCKLRNTEKYVWLYTSLNDYKSDVGNALLSKPITDKQLPDFTVCWTYDLKSGDYWLSLRSNDDKVDICEIAKQLDTKGFGGGHRNAAGCTLSNGQSIRDWFIPL